MLARLIGLAPANDPREPPIGPPPEIEPRDIRSWTGECVMLCRSATLDLFGGVLPLGLRDDEGRAPTESR